jgi:hypothetical protein
MPLAPVYHPRINSASRGEDPRSLLVSANKKGGLGELKGLFAKKVTDTLRQKGD